MFYGSPSRTMFFPCILWRKGLYMIFETLNMLCLFAFRLRWITRSKRAHSDRPCQPAPTLSLSGRPLNQWSPPSHSWLWLPDRWFPYSMYVSENGQVFGSWSQFLLVCQAPMFVLRHGDKEFAEVISAIITLQKHLTWHTLSYCYDDLKNNVWICSFSDSCNC